MILEIIAGACLYLGIMALVCHFFQVATHSDTDEEYFLAHEHYNACTDSDCQYCSDINSDKQINFV